MSGLCRFQKQPDPMPSQAYIWDTSQSNVPITELSGQSPLVSIKYNNKITDVIAGGCYNGLICRSQVESLLKPASAPLSRDMGSLCYLTKKSLLVSSVVWESRHRGPSEFVTEAAGGGDVWFECLVLRSAVGPPEGNKTGRRFTARDEPLRPCL